MHRSNYRCYSITSARVGSEGGMVRPSAFGPNRFPDEDVLSLVGSDDKFRGERDPGVNGICDEAVGFDAFHGFAGRLEFGVALEGDAGSDGDFGDVVLPLDLLEQAFGFAFISDRSQASGLSEREECQHHARPLKQDFRLAGMNGWTALMCCLLFLPLQLLPPAMLGLSRTWLGLANVCYRSSSSSAFASRKSRVANPSVNEP